MRAAYEVVKNKAKKHAPHAAAGAALGVGTGQYEARKDHGAARKKVVELSGKHDRSFGEATALGKARTELTLSEYAKKHPGKYTARSAAVGGALGGMLGPEGVELLRKARDNVRATRAVKE
jgi:hypothetical protein